MADRPIVDDPTAKGRVRVLRDRGRVAGRRRRSATAPRARRLARGRATGPPLVLLHGLAASWAWWRRNIPALVRVVPGHGHRPARLRRHAPGRPVRARRRRPARWSSSWTDAGHRAGARHRALDGRRRRGRHRRGPSRARGPARPGRRRLHRPRPVVAAPDHRRRSRRCPGARRRMAPVLVRDLWRSGLVRMAGATRRGRCGNDWQAKLPSIQAPTLVVWGEHDGICAPTHRPPDRRRRSPARRLVVIPGAGHNPMWERADGIRSSTSWRSSGRRPRRRPEAVLPQSGPPARRSRIDG